MFSLNSIIVQDSINMISKERSEKKRIGRAVHMGSGRDFIFERKISLPSNCQLLCIRLLCAPFGFEVVTWAKQ